MRHPFLRTLAGYAATPTDPNFENVTLLLHGDGTNGGQNNTFVDGSTNNFTITRNGNTTQGTFSPYGDNWSNYFDGTGDQLTLPTGQTPLNVSNSDFTIECWVFRMKSGTARIFNGQGDFSANSTNSYRLLVEDSGSGSEVCVGSTAYQVASPNPSLNKWAHIALVRTGGTLSTYLDGERVGTNTTLGTSTVNTGSTAYGPSAGGAINGTSAPFTGYISNLRLIKGSGGYDATQTTITVPTAPLTAVANTSLLMCHSNRFRDASTNNFAITRSGDVSVQRFSPFPPLASYSASTIGGSGYFDGSGDNIYVSSATGLCDFSTGQAFTIQVWVYRLGTGGMQIIQGGLNTFSVSLEGSGNRGWSYGKAGVVNVIADSGSAPVGVWTHCTISRDTSNRSRMWVNGVSVGSSTSDNYSFNTAATYVGSTSPTSSNFVNGYLCDLRIVKGTALFDPTSSANIDIPTGPLTAVTNTSFLLNFTNAAILDNAMMAVPETVGNAQIDTTTKKYGTGSMKFDGNGDYLILPLSESYRLGTGDFTIELWVYFNALTAYQCLLDMRNGTGAAVGVVLYTNGDSSPNVLRFYTVGANRIATSALSTGQWYHVALTRSGTSTKLFINGTQAGSTYTDSNDYIINSPRISIFSDAASGYVNGFIDDFRITKGVARYTANFTAPTAAFPDL